ncbi:hypothetical protein [Paraflavitalea pollutisoli]|uniref:hypothetical protein n=1 Tax=Paraflavitalea pollutisoli TaxID=3034143 RepID=UPI0023EC0DBA|nr:hypothetical protein [Paraflavitalea sp. H1-2-19X]
MSTPFLKSWHERARRYGGLFFMLKVVWLDGNDQLPLVRQQTPVIFFTNMGENAQAVAFVG